MNVNEIYSDITSFWDSIYPIILFHFIFYLLYRFIFGNFSLKFMLEKYIETPGFLRTKKLFEQFELWTKLPFIILISALIYFALFNSVTNLVSSIRVFPFDFVYSNDEFIREFEPKADLLDIAKYGNDTTGQFYLIDQLRQKYLDEYKVKHQEKYDSWVGWYNKTFGKRLRYFHLFECLILLLIVIYFKQLRQQEGKRLRVTFKLLLVFLFSLPILFILRYQAEQKVEERFAMELMFVRTELATDNIQKPIWTQEQIARVKKKWEDEMNYDRLNHNIFWVSRYVEKSEILEAILGKRRLRQLSYNNN